jgi:hypothetical protein
MSTKKTVGSVLKEYAISALFTFLTGFVIATVAYINNTQNVTFETFLDTGFIVGMVLASVRAGIKLVWEYLLPLVPKLLKYFKTFIK